MKIIDINEARERLAVKAEKQEAATILNETFSEVWGGFMTKEEQLEETAVRG